MKIVILKGTVAGGRNRKVGDRVDVKDDDAEYLIYVGKACADTAENKDLIASAIKGKETVVVPGKSTPSVNGGWVNKAINIFSYRLW